MSSVAVELDRLLTEIGYKYAKTKNYGFVVPFAGKNGSIDIHVFAETADFDRASGSVCSISARLSFYTPSEKIKDVLYFLNEKSSVMAVGAYELQTAHAIAAFKIGFLTYPGLTPNILERYIMTTLIAMQDVEEQVWDISAKKI